MRWQTVGEIGSRAVAAALLVVLAGSAPASARSIEGVKRELEKIEDQLRASDWAKAKANCDDALRDLIEDNARGRGARPIYGLALAFRAIAEAGLDDTGSAVWDWSAASGFSLEATRFDTSSFGRAGIALRAALSAPEELFDATEGLKPHGSLRAPHVPLMMPAYKHYLFNCSITSALIIDGGGRPTRVDKLEGNCLDSDTALAFLAVVTTREWRFEPAVRDGRSVSVRWAGTTTFKRPSGQEPPK